MSSKLRVLALCGFAQNAWVFSKHMAGIQKACPDVEFVFLDPPVVLKHADFRETLAVLNSPLVLDERGLDDPQTAPRAWWRFGPDNKEYYEAARGRMTGFDEAIAYLHAYLSHNPPFDGVLGFSQGGVAATLLCAMISNPNLHPSFPASEAIVPFKFLITCGSFIPYTVHHFAPQFVPYFPLPAELTSLHIIGKNDIIVREESSRNLAAHCLNSRVECHEGGHFVPRKANWRAFFNAYLSSFLPGGTNGHGIPPPIAFQTHIKGCPSHLLTPPHTPTSSSSGATFPSDTNSENGTSFTDTDIETHDWSISVNNAKPRACWHVGTYVKAEKARFRF
ncbi:hypothetical protein IAR55_002426 [Kwoniella newhampshirensis]|uniref:Serine hydrolase domain-containing protein n=1 Tax=Kwoniella newhampshirensis TaxID=1651941 RepID=A0AAW0YR04_9TREE